MTTISQFSPSLSQGTDYKKRHRKIKESLAHKIEKVNVKEGFGGFGSIFSPTAGDLTKETNTVLSKTNIAGNIPAINNLNEQYNSNIYNYETTIEDLNGNTTDYFNRIDPNNPYLGKNIVMGGNTMYVTQQGVAKWYPSYNVFVETIGKNGCPTNAPPDVVAVDLPWNSNYANPGVTIPTNPPLITGTPMVSGQSCGYEGTNVYVNQVLNNPSSTYQGCFADNPSNPLMTVVNYNSSGENGYSYAQCEQAALDEGYSYFGLQDVDVASATGKCTISNNYNTATSLGAAYAPLGAKPLWASGTYGHPGNSAILTVTGVLSVLNSGGTSTFSTPATNAQPNNYLGCYADYGYYGTGNTRAMPLLTGGSQSYTYETCQQAAQQQGAQYFGLQDSYYGNNAQCGLSNDFAQLSEYGPASNCNETNGLLSGGGWSNAVYNTNLPQSNYFLMVQDDGNLVIYRGAGPTIVTGYGNASSSDQGFIWASNTNGQLISSSTGFLAKYGKNGRNWISSGETLAENEWIGSNNGYSALIMQGDGNLVLYTAVNEINCKRMSDGNTGGGGPIGGGATANAIYKLNATGKPGDLGNIAYIDENAELHPYPESNSQYENGYTKIQNFNSPYHDLPNAAYNANSVEQCTQTCDLDPNCDGFVYGPGNICWPKNSGMYPNGIRYPAQGLDIYKKNKGPENVPIGVPLTTTNIDSAKYNNYINGGNISNKYGLAKLSQANQNKLKQMRQGLNNQAQQIIDTNNTLQGDNALVTWQTLKNTLGLNEYTQNLVDTKEKIQNFNTSNVDNILNDSDITVLQRNYNYLFWSILATGTVLVSMNILK